MIARGAPAFVTRQCSFKKRQSHVTAVRFRLTGKIEIAKTFSSPWPAMSLIPSESYSFPDHFTSTVTPSRKPKNQEPEPAPLEIRRKKPSIMALPDPTPTPAPVPPVTEENPAPVRNEIPASPVIREDVQPVRTETLAPLVIPEDPEPVQTKVPAPAGPPAPNPALKRASAPPPRISEPPKKIALSAMLKPKVRWNNR